MCQYGCPRCGAIHHVYERFNRYEKPRIYQDDDKCTTCNDSKFGRNFDVFYWDFMEKS